MGRIRHPSLYGGLELVDKPRYTVRHPAPEDSKFAPNAFKGVIGKKIPVNLNDEIRCGAKVVAAKVIDDGRAVELNNRN